MYAYSTCTHIYNMHTFNMCTPPTLPPRILGGYITLAYFCGPKL